MAKRLPMLALSLIFVMAATLMPQRGDADCDPTGWRTYKTTHAVANEWADGHSCGPPPEQAWCISDYSAPPTTCCNGYHEEQDEPTDNCFYCIYEWYVCN